MNSAKANLRSVIYAYTIFQVAITQFKFQLKCATQTTYHESAEYIGFEIKITNQKKDFKSRFQIL